MKSKWLLLVAMLGMGSQAHAHAPVTFPLIHGASAHSSVLTGLVLKNAVHSGSMITSRVPGYSLSQSIFSKEVKLYTGQGVVEGIVGAFNKGNINGQITGTFYQELYPSFGGAKSFGGSLFAVGNSPYLTNPTPTASGSTSISFSSAGKTGVGFPLRLSGGQSIVQNQLSSLVLNGAIVGRQNASQLLTGGYFSGTGYEFNGSPPNVFGSFGNLGFAFGNSPLNISRNASAGLISTYPTQTSYLNFKNKINIPIGSAQLYAEVYNALPGGTFVRQVGNPFVFTAGSNPFNKPMNTVSFNETFLNKTSFINLLFKFF